MGNSSTKVRNSSIEALKVIGIVLIVVSHVVQTLNDSNSYMASQDYIVNLSAATNDIQRLILIMLRYSGALGNTIFFVCSSWFLIDSQKSNKKKILQMLLDIWTISILILVITFALRNGKIGIKIIIMSIFPTTFASNWYITCYLLFYVLHPFLNKIISQVTQRTMLRCTLLLTFLYIFCDYVRSELFFSSKLILWVTIYFLIAYMKLYLKDISNNMKFNVTILLIGFVGNYGIILLTNSLGLYMSLFKNQLQYWNSNCSPFMILMVIGLLNIARNIHFENAIINYISKLSMLIYVIHENIILRTYYRPIMWQYVYRNFGYHKIILWTFAFVIIVFAFGFFASVLYEKLIQKFVGKISERLYGRLINCYGYIEKILMHIQ